MHGGQNRDKPIVHRVVNAPGEEPESSLSLLNKAVRDVARAKAELDRVLRAQFPIGVSIVFVRGSKREGGTIVAHGHDGTVTVRLTEAPSKTKRVSAHEIRA